MKNIKTLFNCKTEVFDTALHLAVDAVKYNIFNCNFKYKEIDPEPRKKD